MSYRYEIECEHSNCSARFLHEVTIAKRDFRFCGHHCRKILRVLYPEVSEKAILKLFKGA